SSLLALPLVNLLVRKLGKLRAYIICGFLWIATLPAYALYPQGAADTFLYFCVWLGFTYAAGITIPWAMLPDVLEYDELQTGNRSEGLFTAYMVFFRKLGGAVAVFVANLILAQAGFIEATYGTGIEQPQSVVTALRLLSGVLPTLLVAVGIFVIRKYPITRDRHRALLAELAERRRNDPVAAN
ncbi:MAG: MFS transporter, partial [Caldilineaceae bacterium]|nr:MFS transporter [Caldilineaceae bacterium]